MVKTIEIDFEIGDIVFVKTDEKQLERMVMKIHISPNGVTYTLAQSTTEQSFFAIEISKEKSFLNNRKIGFGS